MKKRILVTAITCCAATGAFANTVNDAQSNGMGGTGVAQNPERNPAFHAPSQNADDSWRLRLLTSTVYANDPEDFVGALEDFIDSDLDTITGFDATGLSNSLSTLVSQVTDTGNAAEAFKDDLNNGSKKSALEAERDELDTANDDAKAEIRKAEDVVELADENFSTLSSRPMDAGLLASLGVDVPLSSAPFSLTLDNQARLGLQLNYESNDADNFTNITDDTEEYLERLDAVSDALKTLLEADQNDPQAVQAAFDEYEEAQQAFEQETTNGVYSADGEFNASLDSDDFDSTVDVLGSNITSLKFGLGQQLYFPRGTLSVGGVLKAQLIQVFGQRLGVESADTIDADTVLENTEQYVAGNADLGAAYELSVNRFGTVALGTSVQDLFPMSFEAANGESVDISPKVRAGLAHRTDLTLLSLDVDLTENDPVGYGVTSQYVGLGAEFNAWDWAAIRGGYRHNLAVDDDQIVSAGLALTPWIANVEVSAWTRPDIGSVTDLARSSGVTADLSVRW